MNFEQLLDWCSKTAYPEPESPLHSAIIPQAVGTLAQHLQPGSKVLDVGCGSSLQAAKMFRDLGHQPTCISVLEKEVALAREHGFEALRLDMHDLDNGTTFSCLGLYHAVFLRHVIEHSPCPLLVLHQAREITAPGGFLYLEVPEPWTACNHELNPNHFSVLDRLAWAALLIRAGWEIVSEGSYKSLTQAGPDSYYFALCRKAPTGPTIPTGQT